MNCTAKNKLFYVIIILCTLAMPAKAQKDTNVGLPEEVLAWTKSTMDSLSFKHYRSLKEAMIDNDFYIPIVFRGAICPKLDLNYSIDSVLQRNIPRAYNYESKKIKYLFRHYKFKKALEDNAYKEVMLKNPENFQYVMRQLPKKTLRPESIKKSREVKLAVEGPKKMEEKVDPTIKFIPDRKYWTSNAELSLKFTQSHISPNWYKGGNDYLSIYGRIVLYYNYQRGKTKLNNTLDASALFYNAPDDSLREYRIGSDVLRYTSQLGYKAFGKWDYSSSFTFTTQMFNNYAQNTNNKLAGFLSPYRIDLTIGMKYTLNAKFKKPNRAFTLPISIDPLAFMFMQSITEEMDLARHGFPTNDDGTRKSTYRTFGSSIKIDRIAATFNKNFNMTWRLYYFTNYERIIGESEMNLNFQVSRFLSTSFNLYLRYDDGITRKEDYYHYLQINELLSFGFNYKW